MSIPSSASPAFSPDMAPDLEPGVVRWQPRRKTPARRAAELQVVISAGALAMARKAREGGG